MGREGFEPPLNRFCAGGFNRYANGPHYDEEVLLMAKSPTYRQNENLGDAVQ